MESTESSTKTPVKSKREKLAREKCERAIGVLQRVIASESETESMRVAVREELDRLKMALKDSALLGKIFGIGAGNGEKEARQ
jgi:hypothetical protein